MPPPNHVAMRVLLIVLTVTVVGLLVLAGVRSGLLGTVFADAASLWRSAKA